jgi:hypothetical protein
MKACSTGTGHHRVWIAIELLLFLLIHGVGGTEAGSGARETSVTFRTVPEVWYLN